MHSFFHCETCLHKNNNNNKTINMMNDSLEYVSRRVNSLRSIYETTNFILKKEKKWIKSTLPDQADYSRLIHTNHFQIVVFLSHPLRRKKHGDHEEEARGGERRVRASGCNVRKEKRGRSSFAFTSSFLNSLLLLLSLRS